MAEYTYINGDFSKLKEVLEKSELFKSVSTKSWQDSYAYSGITCDTDDKDGFFLFGTTGKTGNIYVTFTVNTDATPNFKWKGSGTTLTAVYFPISAYVTKNGVSIVCNSARILITRNQNGKVVIVTGAVDDSSSTQTDNYMASISAIAETDNMPFNPTGTNISIRKQTLIIPICTLSSTLSYTDKAGWLAYKQNTSIGNILYNGKQYFTDGYFVMEDEGDNA